MSIRVGIVGISGFGGGEAMRLVASHPSFELVYAAGEGSAGSHLVDRFPGVPARLAGCREVVLCTPPRTDGSADPAVLVAAKLAGVDRVFKLGGAQAVAALAFGTASVPKVDKVFGPGNSYVDEAKRQVAQSGAAAIDMPAGPSEVLVIADDGADAAFVAADLLSQAEHGPDSQVMLVALSAGFAARVQVELAARLRLLPRGAIVTKALEKSRVILAASPAEAVEIANLYAPEHLILQVGNPRALLPGITTSGSVFEMTAMALGTSAASPTTSTRSPRAERTPTRTSSWSSTRTMRRFMRPSLA